MVDPTRNERDKSARAIQVPKVQQGGQGQQIPKPPQMFTPLSEFKPKQLDPEMFPNPPIGRGGPPTTLANVEHMLIQNGISVRYNLCKKKLEMTIPGVRTTFENADNVFMTHIISLAAQNDMKLVSVPEIVYAIADHNAYNPAADWIASRPWDGVDRLQDYYDTLGTREGFPLELKKVLMGKWLLSLVAAALSVQGFRARGVLTLQGEQGLGKTTWGRNLISDKILRDSLVKTDQHFEGGSKDSFLSAITHWLVEIGELENSLRREIARLKGFVTADYDKIRRPYARFDSEYPRRTVFYATVNQTDFLQDNTGNSRWWTLPVVAIDYNHGIDMQQVFAQLAVDFYEGAEWWLTPEEEVQLEAQNRKHQSISVVREALADVIDFEDEPTPDDRALTPTELLKLANMKWPTNPQAKEAGAILRGSFGEPKRINGRDKWRVPLLPGSWDDEPRLSSQPVGSTRPPKNFD